MQGRNQVIHQILSLLEQKSKSTKVIYISLQHCRGSKSYNKENQISVLRIHRPKMILGPHIVRQFKTNENLVPR